MISTRSPRLKRYAATIVETALVITVAMMMIYGVYEYCRLLMMKQLVEGAAREGARFAIAHTGDGTTVADITNVVKNHLAGFDTNIENYSVTVSGIALKTGTVTKGTTVTWDDASPTDGISVQIKGNFVSLVPSLLKMPSKMALDTKVIMYSEGN